MNTHTTRLDARSRERGSALLTAIIFTFAVAVMALSYLGLATSEYKSALRSYLWTSSLNMAESGVEYAVNQMMTDSAPNQSTWTYTDANVYTDGGNTGGYRVVVLNATSSTPTIYSEGIVTGHPSGDIVKQVMVNMSSGFQPFAQGFAAKNGITFSGNNVVLDSYNSDYGAYGDNITGMAGVPADFGYENGGLTYNKNDDIIVASDSVVAKDGLIDQGNADVYGYVAVSEGSTVEIGPNGKVTSYESGSHEEERVRNDFYSDFPVISAPTGGTSHPDVTSSDAISGGTYELGKIDLSGKNKLTISGDVVLIVTGSISVTGQASIEMNSGASLEIYVAGNVGISGGGIVNTDLVPSDLQIYGTKELDSDGSASQVISISGNGQLAAAVYAPSAIVALNGGGNSGAVYGSAVGYESYVTGNSSFHFDEALRDLEDDELSYTVGDWLEMTGYTADTTPVDLSDYF